MNNIDVFAEGTRRWVSGRSCLGKHVSFAFCVCGTKICNVAEEVVLDIEETEHEYADPYSIDASVSVLEPSPTPTVSTRPNNEKAVKPGKH